MTHSKPIRQSEWRDNIDYLPIQFYYLKFGFGINQGVCGWWSHTLIGQGFSEASWRIHFIYLMNFYPALTQEGVHNNYVFHIIIITTMWSRSGSVMLTGLKSPSKFYGKWGFELVSPYTTCHTGSVPRLGMPQIVINYPLPSPKLTSIYPPNHSKPWSLTRYYFLKNL